ncbi:integral membrane protein [Maribacter sedimenticola]|uniref:Integral membrane protein n=2 Tax=Maribacter TaxID=252356 RepID=A0ABY1SMC1_9FLAO|nr:DUF3817 domain-containing protein [Maribacter sedimenticola]SNR77693.1 integral membrane protein [Maribacter sedimenticola]
MLKLFRATAILEGISYLALFGISMPLKYWAEIPGPNKIIGNIHGILFIAYIILTVVVGLKYKWSIKKLLIFGIASLLPFATFYVEEKYLRKQNAIQH